MPQKKLAQEVSECPSPHVSLLDRWCLSHSGGRGPASRPGCLGCVLDLGNEACCALGGSPPPRHPQSKHRILETREERGSSDPCTQGVAESDYHPVTPHP